VPFDATTGGRAIALVGDGLALARPAATLVAHDGIETALDGISITGPVGAGLGLMLDSPLFEVAEDNTGITFGSNARFQVSVGNGPGQCEPPPGAPDFTRSYSKPEAFPVFGANTPPPSNTPPVCRPTPVVLIAALIVRCFSIVGRRRSREEYRFGSMG